MWENSNVLSRIMLELNDLQSSFEASIDLHEKPLINHHRVWRTLSTFPKHLNWKLKAIKNLLICSIETFTMCKNSKNFHCILISYNGTNKYSIYSSKNLLNVKNLWWCSRLIKKFIFGQLEIDWTSCLSEATKKYYSVTALIHTWTRQPHRTRFTRCARQLNCVIRADIDVGHSLRVLLLYSSMIVKLSRIS